MKVAGHAFGKRPRQKPTLSTPHLVVQVSIWNTYIGDGTAGYALLQPRSSKGDRGREEGDEEEGEGEGDGDGDGDGDGEGEGEGEGRFLAQAPDFPKGRATCWDLVEVAA
ncbi:hypothetical protein P692DRAFT_201811176 [Suillus brevipes Sb2]|nr:hypothetical protein P692DRAFT_201811176 [Suillus brevipes Sb2]